MKLLRLMGYTAIITLAASSCSTSSQPRDSLSSGAGITIDFETFAGEAPQGMTLGDGAITGETGVSNIIARDTMVFMEGASSLRISGGDSTTVWRSLSLQIPDSVESVTARMYVKGEDLIRQANQFENCYAGFWFEGYTGNRSYAVEQLSQGTFDWTEITVSLQIDAQLASNVRYAIFSSISGTLWVDNLTLEFDQPGMADEIQGPLSEYIADLQRPATFMELVHYNEEDCPDSITSSQAREDIQHLRYMFENGYSGYAYWKNRGIDFDGLFSGLEDIVTARETVVVREFEEAIASGLQGIQDGHLCIYGQDTYRFLERKSPFFADVIVERSLNDGELRVVISGAEGVQEGLVYAGAEENLFRILSRQGVEQYQLGILSNTEVSDTTFRFLSADNPGEEMQLPVPLHRCRLTEATHIDSVFCITETQGIPLLRISTFAPDDQESMQEFASCGSTFAQSDKLIVDLMGNRGGSSRYAQEFVTGLNGVAQWRMYYAELLSPATVGSIAAIPITDDSPPRTIEVVTQMRNTLERLRENPVRTWVNIREEIPPRQTGSYSGQAVFLVDRYVASSGEALVDYSKSIQNAVLVGENSAGVGTFGEVSGYWLPNSRIGVYLPCKLFIVPGFEEGVGYLPDYWLDSTDPVGEVARWLNNPDDYQFQF